MNTNPLPFGSRTFLSALAWTQPHRRTRQSALLLISVLCLLSSVLCPPPSARAATFPGNARVEISDPNGGLSWSNSVNALTVQCWFKISIPSGFVPTENMTILVNNSTNGTTSQNHAYHLYYNYSKRTIEFSTRGSGGYWQATVIDQPWPDRWYHVAVARGGTSLKAYVDGRLATNATPPLTVGDSRSTAGVSIGGWGNSKYLYGEVQEVSIYHANLDDTYIVGNMFRDQPADPNDFFRMRGYFKLGFAPTNQLQNLALLKPVGTDAGMIQPSGGGVAFEETDQAGEQSSFDARRNGGAEAVAPLSGSFYWEQGVLARPTPGVPFDFRIAYGSGSTEEGDLGIGWHHSFETRLLPAQKFSPLADAAVIGVQMWNGALETWDQVGASTNYTTRRKEYAGEFFQSDTNFLWVTPERMVYTFRQPQSGEPQMRGRLISIRDFNTNEIRLEYNEIAGVLTNVVDSAGGQYAFTYYPSNSQLGVVTFGQWTVQFFYDSASRLNSKSLTNTSGMYTNLNTTIRFNYYTNGISSNLLHSIIDPLGRTNVLLAYDEYGRRTNTINALFQTNRIEYGAPQVRQIRTTDPEGFQWVSTYDRSGRVIAQRDPLGNESRSTYDSHGNRIAATDARGHTTFFQYDERRNVLAQTNALGEVTRRTFHPFFNKPVTQTDPLGWVTTFEYDSAGNLTNQFDALGLLARVIYRTNGLVKTQTDANGNTTQFGYDTNGFRIAETDAAGFTKRYRPNDVGWPLVITNALGEVTTYAYDLNGKTVRTVDPLGRVYAGTYDENGNQRTQTDPKGQWAYFNYDALNQRIYEVDRSGATNWFAYTKRGKQAAMTNALGHVTINQYDAANRQTNQVDALGNSQTTVFDANGNAIAVIDELGQRWTKTYDALNRVVAEADPFGNTARTLYDPAGRVRQIIGPEGAATTQTYDGRGRLVNRADATGSVWRYDCDGVGNITNITDAMGGHYTMVYGNRNERILERNQDGKEWHYTYDALKRLKTQSEPNGTVRTVEYDTGSRVASVSFNTGRVNSFLYDDNDNPVVLSRSGSGPATISQLAYDAMDRVQQYTDAFYKTVRYTYDGGGRLTSLTYPDGKMLTNRYDKLNQLTNQVFQFSAQQAFTNNYAYDKAGRLIRRAYPNGVVQTNSYDAAGHLAGLSHGPFNPQPGKHRIAFDYAYDRNGNAIVAGNQGAFEWPVPGLLDETSRFTLAGRITNRVDALNAAINNFTYRYDPSGNMTNCVGAGQTWTLSYDEDNRTTGMLWTDGALNDVAITNRYDALGRRIARTADGILTGFVLDLSGDMERILCDLDAARNITAYYVHGFDLTFKVSPDGSLTCYHPDAHGNIIALTDAGVNLVAEYAYTPYGRSLGSTNYSAQIANPYLYAGSQGVMEELPGLYFMRARYYSAEAGVFLSTDPVQNIGPTWLPIAYVYAECNPLRFNDPKGEFLNFIIGAVVGFVSDIVIQTVIEGKSFDEINWGRAAISGAVGALTGGLGGLAAGLNIGLRIAANVAVGAITTALAKPFQNLAEGEGFNFEGLSGADVLMGGVMGALGGGGSKGGAKGGNALTQWLRKSGSEKFLKKYPDLAKTWTAAQRLPWRQFSEWHKALPKGVTDGGVAGLKLLQQAGRGVAWGVGEAGTLLEAGYREKAENWGFNYIPKLGDPWD